MVHQPLLGENVPLTFGVTYFCLELECDLVFAFFFSNHAVYLVCQYRQSGANDNDRYSLVVLHGWNVDIRCSRLCYVFQRLVCKTAPIRKICQFVVWGLLVMLCKHIKFSEL